MGEDVPDDADSFFLSFESLFRDSCTFTVIS